MACTPPVTIKPVTIEWVRVDVGLPTHPKAVLLSTILGNPLAWAYVVACWAYAANHARDGRITARMQPVMERLAGWTGEPGGLVRALVEAGFADQDGSDIALHKWEERQGKAIAQTVRDTERRRVARAAAQAQRQRESEEAAASRGQGPGPGAAPARPRRGPGAAPLDGDGDGDGDGDKKLLSLGDAVAPPGGEEGKAPRRVGAAKPFALESPPAGKPPRRPSLAEALYATMEEGRSEECKRAGVAYVAEGWAPARVNKALGDVAKLEGDAAKRFQATWDAYLDAPENAARSPPYSLSFFLASRSTWESKALQVAAEASP